MNTASNFLLIISLFLLQIKIICQTNIKEIKEFSNITLNNKKAVLSKKVLVGNTNKKQDIISELTLEYKSLSELTNKHIPTTKELDELFAQNYNSTQRFEIKYCPKTIKCSATSSLENSDLLYNLILTSVFTGTISHPHICNVCKNWNDSYKNQVPCHNCKNERTLFCEKLFTCPLCDGKGKRKTAIEGEEDLRLINYIKKQYDIDLIYLSYYNSENDFGIYKIDSFSDKGETYKLSDNYNNGFFSFILIDGPSNEKIKKDQDIKSIEEIQTFINKKEYSKAISIYKNLNMPNEEIFQKIEKIEIENQFNVARLVKENRLNDAISEYNKLVKKTDYLNSLFVDYYQKKFNDTTITIDYINGVNILKKYFSDKLHIHKTDNYKLQLTNQGYINVFDVNNNIIASNNSDKSEIRTIKIYDFVIPVKSEFSYQVMETNSKIKLTKNNVEISYRDEIPQKIKTVIEKNLYPNVIGKYTLIYVQKSFNNTLFIDTVKCTNFRGIGGPINAFKSILVPGWGVKSVTGGLKSGWPTTLATYSLFTTAFIFKNLSNTNYDNYLKSTTRSENTTYYDNANMYNKTFYFFTAAGVAFWLFDVVRVSKKGFENNKTRKNTIKNLTLNIDNQSKTFAVGYKIKL